MSTGMNSLTEQIIHHNIGATLYNLSEDNGYIKSVIGSNNLDEIATYIIIMAHEVNFESYLTNMGSNSSRYYRNGLFSPPNRIIAVVTVDYMINLINKIKLSIGQLYSNDADIKVAYIYNGKYWLTISDGWIKNLLCNILKKMGNDPAESMTNNMITELVKTFWNNCPKTPLRDAKSSFINLNNGTLEVLSDGETVLNSHSKDNFLMYCLPYDYEQVTVLNIFQRYLDRVLPDKDSQIVLQELFGSIFIKNINLEKIGILFGGGSNGKSCLLNIILALLGSENISQMDLKSLTTDSNAANNRSHLMNKLLNFAPELNAKGEQSHDLIKRLASGESIQVKLLYQNTITISNYARLIFNCNSLIADTEHTIGFYRRFLIIPFEQTITDEEKDPELASKIIENELPGILNWIIEGAKRLQKQKRFSPCKKSDDIMAQYKRDSDVVHTFLDENNYIADQNSTVELSKLYNELKNFIINNGYKSISIKTFAERLRYLGFKTYKAKGYGTKVYITKD